MPVLTIGIAGALRRRPGAFSAAALAVVACGGDGDDPAGPTLPTGGTLPVEVPADYRDCRTGATESGALVELCLPAEWNGKLIAWAHGYVNPGPERPPGTPLSIPEDRAGGLSVRAVVLGIGSTGEGFYGYATTSYRRNGLVAAEAVDDVAQLVEWTGGELRPLAAGNGFDAGLPLDVLVVGASEGGLTAALAVEEGGAPSVAGGLALCGPIGDFRGQIDWFGDFRVLFDHYFPGIMPGSAVAIDEQITEARWAELQVEIRAALEADPSTAAELMAVAGVPLDPADPGAAATAAVLLLRYSWFATEDAKVVLGGNPFGNVERSYAGSSDDGALNEAVDRFAADDAALAALAAYETAGRLRVPLVTLHTSGDPVVPARQQEAHASRVAAAGASSRLTALPPPTGFEHCGFAAPDLLTAFSALIEATTSAAAVVDADLFSTEGERRAFLRRAAGAGLAPRLVGGLEPR